LSMARPEGQVMRIEVDKPAKVVRAFGRNDEPVAFYVVGAGTGAVSGLF
jgi:hypothetical protein